MVVLLSLTVKAEDASYISQESYDSTVNEEENSEEESKSEILMGIGSMNWGEVVGSLKEKSVDRKYKDHHSEVDETHEVIKLNTCEVEENDNYQKLVGDLLIHVLGFKVPELAKEEFDEQYAWEMDDHHDKVDHYENVKRVADKSKNTCVESLLLSELKMHYIDRREHCGESVENESLGVRSPHD